MSLKFRIEVKTGESHFKDLIVVKGFRATMLDGNKCKQRKEQIQGLDPGRARVRSGESRGGSRGQSGEATDKERMTAASEDPENLVAMRTES